MANIFLFPGAPLPRIGIPHLRAGGSWRKVAIPSLTVQRRLALAVVQQHPLGREAQALLDHALRKEDLHSLIVERFDATPGLLKQLQSLLRADAISRAFENLKGRVDQDLALVPR